MTTSVLFALLLANFYAEGQEIVITLGSGCSSTYLQLEIVPEMSSDCGEEVVSGQILTSDGDVYAESFNTYYNNDIFTMEIKSPDNEQFSSGLTLKLILSDTHVIIFVALITVFTPGTTYYTDTTICETDAPTSAPTYNTLAGQDILDDTSDGMSMSTIIIGVIVVLSCTILGWVLWRRYRLHAPRKQSRRRKKKRTQSSAQSRSIPIDQNNEYWVSKKQSLDRSDRQQSETFHSTSHQFHKHSPHKIINIPSIPQRQEKVPSYSDDDIDEDEGVEDRRISADEEKKDVISPRTMYSTPSGPPPKPGRKSHGTFIRFSTLKNKKGFVDLMPTATKEGFIRRDTFINSLNLKVDPKMLSLMEEQGIYEGYPVMFDIELEYAVNIRLISNVGRDAAKECLNKHKKSTRPDAKYMIYDTKYAFDGSLAKNQCALNIEDMDFEEMEKLINAFLNNQGGHLYLGIDTDWTIKGVTASEIDIPTCKENVMNILSDFQPFKPELASVVEIRCFAVIDKAGEVMEDRMVVRVGVNGPLMGHDKRPILFATSTGDRWKKSSTFITKVVM